MQFYNQARPIICSLLEIQLERKHKLFSMNIYVHVRESSNLASVIELGRAKARG